VAGGQLLIDFDYSETTPKLALEIAIMLAPSMHTGTTVEQTKELAARIAMVAYKRYKDHWEPAEPIRCLLCDTETYPRDRVRVVVCSRCSYEGHSPGSRG
jgi:hypothetical protein